MYTDVCEKRARLVDAQDLSGVLDLFTDDHVLILANREPVVGKEVAGQMMEEFWALIKGLTHHIQSIHEDGDTAVVESLVDYERLDGSVLRVRVCDVLVMEGEKIKETRAYIDLNELWP